MKSRDFTLRGPSPACHVHRLVSPDPQREPATRLSLAMTRVPSSGTSRSLPSAGRHPARWSDRDRAGDRSSPDGLLLDSAGAGLVYLAGALSGGPHGKLLGDGGVLIGWGAAVVVVRQLNPNLDTSGLYLLGAGLGATTGMLLARRGFAVDPLGMTLTIRTRTAGRWG